MQANLRNIFMTVTAVVLMASGAAFAEEKAGSMMKMDNKDMMMNCMGDQKNGKMCGHECMDKAKDGKECSADCKMKKSDCEKMMSGKMQEKTK